MGCIYKVTNNITGDFYIGKTERTIKKRWQNHKTKTNIRTSKLYNSMDKYGKSNFSCISIKEIFDDDDIDELEKHFIKWLQPPLNIREGGGGGLWSDDHKKLLKSKGVYKKTEEQKRKISESKIGKNNGPHTEETKKRISNTHKGLNNWTKNKKWWNNGVECKYCEIQPDGFIRGRLAKHKRGLTPGLVVGTKLSLSEMEIKRRSNHCRTIQKLSPNNHSK
jgi:group I intron endonuclease